LFERWNKWNNWNALFVKLPNKAKSKSLIVYISIIPYFLKFFVPVVPLVPVWLNDTV